VETITASWARRIPRFDRLAQKAAGVETQIENQPFMPFPSVRAARGACRRSAVAEFREAHVADSILEHRRMDAINLDHWA
jgi:hypothetical protein